VSRWQLTTVHGCHLGVRKGTEQRFDGGRVRQQRVLGQKHDEFGICGEALNALLPCGTVVETGAGNGVHMKIGRGLDLAVGRFRVQDDHFGRGRFLLPDRLQKVWPDDARIAGWHQNHRSFSKRI